MKAVYIFIVSLWLMILPYHVGASSLDAVTKAQLQTTMITFLEEAADDSGAFGVIDRDTGFRVAVFPGAIHPRIVPYGADYFLCIEMFDTTGKKYDADASDSRTSSIWVNRLECALVIALKLKNIDADMFDISRNILGKFAGYIIISITEPFDGYGGTRGSSGI